MTLASPQVIIACLLIASYINLILYTYELYLAYQYFCGNERCKKDGLILKLAVAFNVIVDGIGTFFTCALIYQFAVVYWGQTAQLRTSHWTIVIITFTGGLSTFVVQTFMVYRYWTCTSIKIIPVFLFMLVLEVFVTTTLYAAAATARKFKGHHEHYRFVILYHSGLVAANISLTFCLSWKIGHLEIYSQETKSLVRRVIRMLVVTGMVPTVLSLATLITFLSRSDIWQISIAIGLLLGRVFTITMIYALLIREKLRGDSHLQSTFTDTVAVPSPGPTTPPERTPTFT
ncbi:hypothetical protein K443DRAFT_683243 [Laccaria amethystina LaAM-08-1]|uniref:Uncharacterized protein n=1 Tax=Laccaria amethystina LaAM-08-1 TaxID=1095629 RepID=A0A0C9XG82_9AGAR|nr:hypothetical protein K443DRAFT_683243 [Laccaria amethystina LaAM-08-1]